MQANIIKLPNVSASIPQLIEAVTELQAQGYNIPSFTQPPTTEAEKQAADRYAKVPWLPGVLIVSGLPVPSTPLLPCLPTHLFTHNSHVCTYNSAAPCHAQQHHTQHSHLYTYDGAAPCWTYLQLVWLPRGQRSPSQHSKPYRLEPIFIHCSELALQLHIPQRLRPRSIVLALVSKCAQIWLCCMCCLLSC